MNTDTTTPSQRKLFDLRIEQERVQRDFLVIDSAIAEAARAYHVDGVAMPVSRRAALLAQQKALLLQLHDLRVAQRIEKSKALDFKGKSFIGALLDRCIAAGRSDLVNDARAEAAQALDDAGLLDAYRLKN